MASPFPFTAGQVLTAAQLNSIGEGTSFTPVFTNLTLGDATVSAEYFIINEIMFYSVEVTFGSTTAITGAVQFEYPVSTASTWRSATSSQVFCEDSDGNDYYGSLWRNNADQARVSTYTVSGSDITQTVVNTSSPFTWSSSDRLLITGWLKPS